MVLARLRLTSARCAEGNLNEKDGQMELSDYLGE